MTCLLTKNEGFKIIGILWHLTVLIGLGQMTVLYQINRAFCYIWGSLFYKSQSFISLPNITIGNSTLVKCR